VTSFLRPHSEFLTIAEELRHPEYRWTIDTPQDLEFAQKMFAMLKIPFSTARYLDFVGICESNPELIGINQAIRQKTLEDG
jgi:spore coat polysaccharide biosynthesis protein SpsF